MSHIDLYTSPPIPFNCSTSSLEEANYAVFGAPYDRSSTYEANSRWAPIFVRIASMNIETCNLRTGIDLEKVPIADIGDIHMDEDIQTNLRRIEAVILELKASNKLPIMIGGEHSVTLGAVRTLKKGLAVIDFDAHLDLRSSYLGNKYSHACVMRRIVEEIGSDGVFILGPRAVSSEEIRFAEKNKIKYLPSLDFRKKNSKEIEREVKDRLSSFQKIYVTIDADVFDPAYAPDIGNPEPEGLTPTEIFDLFPLLAEKNIQGFDIVEVTASPHHGSGVTIELAARTIFELIAQIEKAKIR
jgi:agmatinase